MKTHYISSSLLAVALFVIAPLTTQAYFTTAQTSKTLNPNTALFTIEYAFGQDDHDLYMPVLAVRDASSTNEKKVGYSILQNGDEGYTEGTATGIVVSKAPIVNGMYKLEKGKAHKMTLFVLFTSPQGSFEEDYALKIDSLPYTVDKGDNDQQLQMNPSELQYYITKETELNTGNYKD